MTTQPHSKVTAWEVIVMYEPTRLAPDALQVAYATVLPTPRRMGVARRSHPDGARQLERHDAEGRAG